MYISFQNLDVKKVVQSTGAPGHDDPGMPTGSPIPGSGVGHVGHGKPLGGFKE